MSFNDVLKSVLNIIETSVTNQNIKIIQELDSNDSFSSYPGTQFQISLYKNSKLCRFDRYTKSYIKRGLIKYKGWYARHLFAV